MTINKTTKVQKCISVVITTFNDEETLMPVLLSLFSSGVSTQNIQLIIVDGGSTDNTLQLIKDFLNEHKGSFRETLLEIHHRNQGVSKARNDGIKLAKCEYVLILDSDIILPSNSIKIMVEY